VVGDSDETQSMNITSESKFKWSVIISKQPITGWWFSIFFIFTPNLGEIRSNLTCAYCSNGLVKNHQLEIHLMVLLIHDSHHINSTFPLPSHLRTSPARHVYHVHLPYRPNRRRQVLGCFHVILRKKDYPPWNSRLFASKNGWLEYDRFLSGQTAYFQVPLLLVSGSVDVCIFFFVPILFFLCWMFFCLASRHQQKDCLCFPFFFL